MSSEFIASEYGADGDETIIWLFGFVFNPLCVSSIPAMNDPTPLSWGASTIFESDHVPLPSLCDPNGTPEVDFLIIVLPIPYIEFGPISPLNRSISPPPTIPGIKFSSAPNLSFAAPTILLLKKPPRAPPAPPSIDPSAALGLSNMFKSEVPSFAKPTSRSLCSFINLFPVGAPGLDDTSHPPIFCLSSTTFS